MFVESEVSRLFLGKFFLKKFFIGPYQCHAIFGITLSGFFVFKIFKQFKKIKSTEKKY